MSRNYISDQELYELKERRMTYPQISQYLAERGIEISERQLARRFSKIYADRNRKVTRGSRITDEELYELKERGMTYKQMIKYFAERGIKISENGLIKRVKKIYTDRNKKILRGSSKRKKKKRPTDKMLYDLKKQGLSYEEIVEVLAGKGIKICLRTVAIRTKKIFEAKGEKVPIAKRKPSKEPREKRKNRSRGRIQVSDQELYRLKQKSMSNSAISKYLERKGIKLCPSAIRVRIKEIYSERGEKIPRGIKGKIYTPPDL